MYTNITSKHTQRKKSKKIIIIIIIIKNHENKPTIRCNWGEGRVAPDKNPRVFREPNVFEVLELVPLGVLHSAGRWEQETNTADSFADFLFVKLKIKFRGVVFGPKPSQSNL